MQWPMSCPRQAGEVSVVDDPADAPPGERPWGLPDMRGSAWQRRWQYTSPFRRRFGLPQGLRMAAMMSRVEWRSATPLHAVQVPGWDAPVWLRSGTTDSVVFRQLVLGDELGFPLPFTPQTIVDGGANIGLATRVFKERWPDAAVLAVELEEGNATMLARNCAMLSGVTIRQGAIWDRDEQVGIDRTGGEYGFQVSTSAAPNVAAWTVDTLLREQGWDSVDLVKLDVEGAEARILRGPLTWLIRTRAVAIELHDRLIPGCTDALAAALGAVDWHIASHGEYVVAVRRETES